jgi:hypothetical protein
MGGDKGEGERTFLKSPSIPLLQRGKLRRTKGRENFIFN